jgi:hypothetical protein
MQPQLSQFQKFNVARVHRSQLVNAEYNPRVITDKAKGRLRKLLAKRGLVETLVWNVRSGRLVSGHQRISCLDALENTQDYLLDVAQIDVDDRTEKELNIALNNGEAQGEWDLEKLEKLYKDDQLDFEATGFDTADIFQMFGETPLVEQPEALVKLAEQYRTIREKHQQLAESLGDRDDPDFWIAVVFATHDDRVKFLEALGLPDNRFTDGRFLTAKLGAQGEAPDGGEPA